MSRKELREAVARALWDEWRMSEVAPPTYLDFTWGDLQHYASERAASKLLKLGLQEADAALSVIIPVCQKVAAKRRAAAEAAHELYAVGEIDEIDAALSAFLPGGSPDAG